MQTDSSKEKIGSAIAVCRLRERKRRAFPFAKPTSGESGMLVAQGVLHWYIALRFFFRRRGLLRFFALAALVKFDPVFAALAVSR